MAVAVAAFVAVVAAFVVVVDNILYRKTINKNKPSRSERDELFLWAMTKITAQHNKTDKHTHTHDRQDEFITSSDSNQKLIHPNLYYLASSSCANRSSSALLAASSRLRISIASRRAWSAARRSASRFSLSSCSSRVVPFPQNPTRTPPHAKRKSQAHQEGFFNYLICTSSAVCFPTQLQSFRIPV